MNITGAMNKLIPTVNKKQVIARFPKRRSDSHKGLFGTVAVIGGATGMIGAPLLAARAALKLGSGCVHVGLLAENVPRVDLSQPELMLHSTASAFRLPGVGVMAIGCGMGNSIAAQKSLYEALMRDTTLVIDADALNLIALHSDLQDDLRTRNAASVLTPHPGEAARLLDCDIKEIQANRVAAVQELESKFACSVVLKGSNSLCAKRNGEIFLNKTGNSGMSSPGMGDVLTGMIAAFIAQGMHPEDAL